VYCKTLTELCRAIQNKRRGILTWCSVPPWNGCLHTAACTQTLLEHFACEFFDHPPCSSDLAPSYYHLFTYLKSWLRSQRFNNKEGLMEGVKTWVSSQAVDVFDTGIQELILRYDKCPNSGNDYVEK
jgi:hypothetical protein